MPAMTSNIVFFCLLHFAMKELEFKTWKGVGRVAEMCKPKVGAPLTMVLNLREKREFSNFFCGMKEMV